MAQRPGDQRRFTDTEVREILQRAADDDAPDALPLTRGLSLADLKAIGKDVGIDPARLEDAARAVAQNQEPGPILIVGIPTVLRYERAVDEEIDLKRTAAILSIIRRVMGHHGEASEVGGSLEWRTRGGSVERLVSVSPSGGRTTIEGSANLRQAAIGTYVSGGLVAIIMAFMGVTASVGGSDLSISGLVLSTGFLAAAYVGLRAIVRRKARSEAEKLQRVVNELAEL